MGTNLSFDLLLSRINDFYHTHGYYPKVKVIMAFWENNAHSIAKLANKHIEINVVDNIRGKNSFLLEGMEEQSSVIDTLFDLKSQVDTWIMEEKVRRAGHLRAAPAASARGGECAAEEAGR
ncbi:hypothetical protein SAMN05443144_1213 [Fodinibius roseus]|uniref:Uncharacterized protein n=1 Tax=Fodinibius roseus TaxID=1194090 RepID=A0A1M5HSG0_9BACT|nr:hypothetical protein SAMN05443144_1213 [Fodinibius roseus]